MSDFAALLRRHRVIFPLALSEDADEIGTVRDAAGMPVFTVDVEGVLPDAETLALASTLLGALNAQALRADAGDLIALVAISGVLFAEAERSEAAMAAFEIAQDALAGRHCTEAARVEA